MNLINSKTLAITRVSRQRKLQREDWILWMQAKYFFGELLVAQTRHGAAGSLPQCQIWSQVILKMHVKTAVIIYTEIPRIAIEFA